MGKIKWGSNLPVELLLSNPEEEFLLDGVRFGPGEAALLAMVNVILPGTGPSVWSIAFRNVSMASLLDWCSNEMLFTFSSWSLVLRRLSRDAAPPFMTLLMKMPRSWEPLVFPLTLIPSPAFSESCTGISKVRISRCFHGKIKLSSDLSRDSWNYLHAQKVTWNWSKKW